MNKRFFCLAAIGAGNTRGDRSMQGAAADRRSSKLFQGDNWVDQFAYGEGFYGPASDNMVAVRGTQRPEDFVQWGRIAREVAKAGMPVNIHTTLEATADGFLDQIEAINKEFPIRNLRWALIHGEQLNASHLERMKKLGMYAVDPAARDDHGRRFSTACTASASYDDAEPEDDPGQRHHVGPRHRHVRGQSVPPVHDAVVRGHRQDGRRHKS